DHLFHAVAIGICDGQPQLLADRQQEFGRRGSRIQDNRYVRMMRHAREQGSHHGCFAGADFPGQLDEAAGFVDAVQQMSQRLGMPLAQIKVARVRRDRERPFTETEEADVHGATRVYQPQPWREPPPPGVRGSKLARVSNVLPKRSRIPSMVASSRDSCGLAANRSPWRSVCRL